MSQQLAVSQTKFINELTREVAYMKTGGTSYRQKTAELSLNLAKKVKDVSVFLNRSDIDDLVYDHHQPLDDDQAQDVAKMLNVVLLDLNLKASQSDDRRLRLLERKKTRKPFRLVPVLD